MARETAAIPTWLWGDPTFTTLTSRAQLRYMLLLTQRHLDLAGTLPLTPRRWARLTNGATAEEVETDLRELEHAGWLLIDWESEEVVLPRLDTPAGHKQLQAALTAAARIQSPRLRMATLERLAAAGHNGRQTQGGNRRMAKMRAAVYARDGYRCMSCQWAPDIPEGYDGRHALGEVEQCRASGVYRVRILELDHVYPESLGGKFELGNLQTLCNSCNSRKGARLIPRQVSR